MIDTVHQLIPDEEFLILFKTLDLASLLRKGEFLRTPYSLRGIASGGLDKINGEAWRRCFLKVWNTSPLSMSTISTRSPSLSCNALPLHFLPLSLTTTTITPGIMSS